MTKKLVVIIRGRLSDYLAKGSLTSRYYNPENLFSEVHFFLPNGDNPDKEAIQFTVGNARLFYHHLPVPSFRKTLGWQTFMLKDWVEQGVQIARDISPNLIKVHNNFIHGYLARMIKQNLGIPYVVSLHGVWDKDDLKNWQNRITRLFRIKFEKTTLKNADATIAVYKSILPYARKYGARNLHLIYNAVSTPDIIRKTTYNLNHPPRLITINRQVIEKNPENILRAIVDIDCHYTLIGDGELHEPLKKLASLLGISHKVEFRKAIANKELMGTLKDYDLMVSHVDYWGISRTVIEASLAGLPVIINEHPIEPIPEYDGNWVRLVRNTPEGYRSAIKDLLGSNEKLEEQGIRAQKHADENFDPATMEKKIAAIYKQILNLK